MAMSSLTGPQQSGSADGGQPVLIFELEWKQAAKSSGKRQDSKAKIGICDPPDPTLDLWLFKSYLCQNLGVSGNVAISYVDSDGDELPIDSECEFREALKFGRSQAKKYKNVLLMINKIEKQESSSNKVVSKQSSLTSACDGLFVIQKKSPSLNTNKEMAPIHMTGIIDNDGKLEENSKSNSPFAPSSLDNQPPSWFRSYMDSMKREIVEEVSTKVMSKVMGVLNTAPSEVCSSCSHSMRRNRHSRESNTEKKQRREKKERAIVEVESSDAFSPPQQTDVQALRRLKKIERFAHNFQKALKRKKLEKLKNSCFNVIVLDNNLDKRRKNSFVPVITSEPSQNEQAKKCDSASNITSSSERRARMNCSITGQEMIEKPTDKVSACGSDSDSDKISMLYDSDNSVNLSDDEHDYNFEMIHTPPCFILDKPLNKCDSQNSKLTETFDNNRPLTVDRQNFNIVCEAESDRKNNEDSPSYEILSGPVSSASSLHLEEDHFHVSRNISEQTLNADLIDLDHEDRNLKKSDALVVDMEGKIFGKSIDHVTNESSEIYLDKRFGGVYAFVNETLPSHASKDNDASQMFKSDTNLGELNNESSNLNLIMENSHPNYESKKNGAAPIVNQSQTTVKPQTDFTSGMANETMYSFSSHSSHATSSSNVDNFTQVQTGTSYTSSKYTVVDNNASKGLEETKYTSCENNLGARGCQSKQGENKRTNAKKVNFNGISRREFTSESSACVFTEQPQKSSVENGTRESSPDFGRATNDSVHILPETLVSGAVNVASSAYSTSRRVFDWFRSIQTEDGHEGVEEGVLDTDLKKYFLILEEMGFTNVELNARLLHQYKFDMSRVISELVE